MQVKIWKEKLLVEVLTFWYSFDSSQWNMELFKNIFQGIPDGQHEQEKGLLGGQDHDVGGQ